MTKIILEMRAISHMKNFRNAEDIPEKRYWYSIVNGAAAACLQQENFRKWDIRQNPWWEESDVIKVRTCFFPQSIVE